MKSYRYTVVDVFTTEALEGNALSSTVGRILRRPTWSPMALPNCSSKSLKSEEPMRAAPWGCRRFRLVAALRSRWLWRHLYRKVNATVKCTRLHEMFGRIRSLPGGPMAETFEAYRTRVLSYLGDEEPIGVQQATPSQL